jgi:hypothetical protein
MMVARWSIDAKFGCEQSAIDRDAGKRRARPGA